MSSHAPNDPATSGSSPTPGDSAAVAAELAARTQKLMPGTRWVLDWVGETGSTNADLLAAAAAGAPSGAVLAAEFQDAGRGRLERRWVAPPGSALLVSILVRPHLDGARAHLVAVAVGIAAARAVDEVAGVHADLKWPNDLVVGTGAATRKLGGVLAESLIVDGVPAAIVVGIGLNVHLAGRLPAELVGIATSLDDHTGGRSLDRTALLASLLRHLDALVDLVDSAGGTSRLLDEYRRRCVTIGTRVRVDLGAEVVIEGDATAVDDDGRLVVVTDDGSTHVVAVGDVVHLRPAI